MEQKYFTLGLKKLPFEPDFNQIIFIEGQHDEEVNRLIRRNFYAIRKCFQKYHFDFCYIPFLKYDLTHGERLHYNAPYAKSAKDVEIMVNDNFILDYMIHPENREKLPSMLLYYHPACWNFRYYEAEEQFRAIQISVESFDGDEDLNKILEAILDDINKKSSNLSNINFHIASKTESKQEESNDDDDILFRLGDDDDHLLARYDDAWDVDADDLFDEESKILIEEIQERCDRLRAKGVEDGLIEDLFKRKTHKLSRLRITKDYQIYLGDYFGMEIKMTPLPKAVFLLFLKHPEGIMFSYLPDFRDELMDIYRKVKGPFFNEATARQSIEDVTNPLSNSINEKCSRIREAFVSQFDDHLARFYYIVGQRGEPKKIALPRTLVKWE